MAAHAVTALNQVKDMLAQEGGIRDDQFSQIAIALGMALWGDLLDFDDWRALKGICEGKLPGALRVWIDERLPAYEKLWDALGQPRTAEDWYNKLYGGDLSDGERKSFLDIINPQRNFGQQILDAIYEDQRKKS